MQQWPLLSSCHEEDGRGLVSAVFRDVRRRMPFVPAVFKALAVEPAALELAWLQARAIYDDPRSQASGERLRKAAHAPLEYRASRAVCEAVEPFAEELPRMLLIVTSLWLALEGALPLGPRPEPALPEPGPLPETPVPEDGSEHPLYAAIRAVYDTSYVPSMFRALAAQGLLDEPWQAIGPFLRSQAGGELVAVLAVAAEREALGFRAAVCFEGASVRPILVQFRRALPLNLVFACAAQTACCIQNHP